MHLDFPKLSKQDVVCSLSRRGQTSETFAGVHVCPVENLVESKCNGFQKVH